MNKERRQELGDVIDYLGDATNRLEEIISDEEDSFDNLPEGLQCSRTGDSMQEAMEHNPLSQQKAPEADNFTPLEKEENS